WPVEECAYRAKGFFIKLDRFQTIQLFMNLRQLFEIARAEILAAGLLGNFAHGVFIKILRGIYPACAEKSGYYHFFGAETNGVDFYVFLLRENCRTLWREFAGITGTVSQQN